MYRQEEYFHVARVAYALLDRGSRMFCLTIDATDESDQKCVFLCKEHFLVLFLFIFSFFIFGG